MPTAEEFNLALIRAAFIRDARCCDESVPEFERAVERVLVGCATHRWAPLAPPFHPESASAAALAVGQAFGHRAGVEQARAAGVPYVVRR